MLCFFSNFLSMIWNHLPRSRTIYPYLYRLMQKETGVSTFPFLRNDTHFCSPLLGTRTHLAFSNWEREFVSHIVFLRKQIQIACSVLESKNVFPFRETKNGESYTPRRKFITQTAHLYYLLIVKLFKTGQRSLFE